MSKFKPKIGWQKYEDVLEKQISSPILSNILGNILQNRVLNSNIDDGSDDLEEINDEDMLGQQMPLVFPMSQKLLEDIHIISNFDCWVGHTNFDVTNKIKDKLDKIPGVELLKICSRYRFFIGIGNMFDFSEVRKNIEKELLSIEK